MKPQFEDDITRNVPFLHLINISYNFKYNVLIGATRIPCRLKNSNIIEAYKSRDSDMENNIGVPAAAATAVTDSIIVAAVIVVLNIIIIRIIIINIIII